MHLEQAHAGLGPPAELLEWHPSRIALVQNPAEREHVTLLIHTGSVEQLGGLRYVYR